MLVSLAMSVSMGVSVSASLCTTLVSKCRVKPVHLESQVSLRLRVYYSLSSAPKLYRSFFAQRYHLVLHFLFPLPA